MVTADILDNDQISKATEYKPLIIGYHNGQAVRLSDVATVVDSAQNIRNAGYLNGIPSVTVIIFRQPGANIIATNELIRSQLPFLQSILPQGIKTTVVLDRTTTIRASVTNVEQTLIISVLLVILVVFVFLRNWHSTLIPTVAVPVSLIGTFAVMWVFGYSLDNLSLMALTISTGFVVDDAIVVMENISRHLEQGMTPFAAALKGFARDRIDHLHDQHVADCSFYSHSDDGRHCGSSVSRICSDAFDGNYHLDGDIADHHSHDVRLHPEGA